MPSFETPRRQVALLTRQWPQAAHARLAERCETRLLMPDADVSSDFFRTFNEDVTILCSSFLDDVDAALLDALPALRLIAHLGTWRRPLTAFTSRGIRVADTGDAGAAEAADHALTLLLAAARGLNEPLPETGARRTLDQGLGYSAAGMSVGLLGVDAVAAELAQRCTALGMRVHYWSPDKATLPQPAVRAADPASLVHERGAVSLHGHAELDATLLAQCAPHTVVVNVAAPALLDETALAGALRDYTIGGAGLDVCADPARLAQCPRCIVTPQLATNTLAARIAMADRVVDNVRAFLEGAALPDPVL